MTTTRTTPAPTSESVPRQPQLLLISDSTNSNPATTATTATRWALDEETRETGRRGLAKARAALRATRPPHLDIAA